MKKIYMIIIGLIGFLFISCSASQIKGEEAWEEFNKALEFTSALQYYSINTVKVSKNVRQEGKLVYTMDDLVGPVAYKKTDQEEAWWVAGLVYWQNQGEKLKRAVSINKFLEISESYIEITYEKVENCLLKNNMVTFEWVLNDSNCYSVKAKLGKIFIEEIVVEVKKTEEKVSFTSITYTYENPGKKPEISLPADLQEYHY